MEADQVPAFPTWFHTGISSSASPHFWAGDVRVEGFGNSGCPLCSQGLIIDCYGHIYCIAGVNNLIYCTLYFFDIFFGLLTTQ